MHPDLSSGAIKSDYCYPCGAATRRVRLSVNIEYDYCDGCKNEIRDGQPVVAAPQSPASQQGTTKFKVGEPVVYIKGHHIAYNFYVCVSKDKSGMVGIVEGRHFQKFFDNSIAAYLVPENELKSDPSRGWMAVPLAPNMQTQAAIPNPNLAQASHSLPPLNARPRKRPGGKARHFPSRTEVYLGQYDPNTDQWQATPVNPAIGGMLMVPDTELEAI